MLKNNTYNVSEYKISIINDKGKDRELMKLPYFPDRIIQWAILLQIEDIFMETFCNHTCASIKNRGINKASKLLNSYLKDRENTKYCLKIDVKKFYPNVNHDILKMLIRKKFKDRELLALLDRIIDSYPNEKGIPIGSYLSQFLANYYLTYFDHWLKEDRKIKYVIRYMDDIVILHCDKGFLHKLLREIEDYLRDNLDLKVKENWQVFPVEVRGIDFVGYRHFYDYKLLRKGTCKKFKRKLIDIKKKQDKKEMISYSEWCSINSYNGWLKWCDSYRLRDKYVKPITPSLVGYYDKVVLRDKDNDSRKKLVNKYVRGIFS
jgi:hypothetical protein